MRRPRAVWQRRASSSLSPGSRTPSLSVLSKSMASSSRTITERFLQPGFRSTSLVRKGRPGPGPGLSGGAATWPACVDSSTGRSRGFYSTLSTTGSGTRAGVSVQPTGRWHWQRRGINWRRRRYWCLCMPTDTCRPGKLRTPSALHVADRRHLLRPGLGRLHAPGVRRDSGRGRRELEPASDGPLLEGLALTLQGSLRVWSAPSAWEAAITRDLFGRRPARMPKVLPRRARRLSP